MAASSFWRGLAPVWLRVLAGLLIFPFLWVGFELLFAGLLARVLPDSLMALLADNLVVLLVLVILVAGIVATLIVRKSSTRRAAALSSLAVLVYAMGSLSMIGARLPRDTFDRMPAEPPQAESPGGEGAELPLQPMQPEAPGPDLGAPSGGGGGGLGGARPRAWLPPQFPWPPPGASASYVLPDKLFESYGTVGDVSAAILEALEENGYVERSFFRTPPGGVALITRLERINDDGSPSAEAERWPAAAQPHESARSLLDFLQGLFFVDPGHYRVIVFVLQDLPFSQSAETITAQQAHAWLTSGANVLPREIANLPFAGAHVTVLIYEFASDGKKVQVVTSQLTGKQHLERAGLLTVLDQVQ